MNVGRLVFPALRWRPETGFRHEEAAIASGLQAGVGGFILFGGRAAEVAELTRALAERAGRPLLFGADLERGAGQQVEGLTELPPPLALASLGDPSVIAAAGALTGLEARSVGISWVYAPVADLDLEPANPIVQTRSFGGDPERVGEAVKDWVRACQAAGVLACAKHFPGHGRTRHDSHDRVPVVTATEGELAQVDLKPFQRAIEAGVASVMTAHVAYPALDPEGIPATFSTRILGRLRTELGFEGLVVTDALVMEGARLGRSVEELGVDAIRAGVDCLLYPPDPVAAVRGLDRAAAADRALGRRVERSLERLETACEGVGAAAAPPPAAAAAGLASRLLRATALDVRLRPPIDLVVVDDDLDGAFPATPSDWAEKALRSRGVPLGPGGSRVVLVFAEPRASKGRAGLGDVSRERLRQAAPGAGAVVVLAHPRVIAEVPPGPPVLLAWHRQRPMQEAVAAWIAARLG